MGRWCFLYSAPIMELIREVGAGFVRGLENLNWP